jgi:hypothetical protein
MLQCIDGADDESVTEVDSLQAMEASSLAQLLGHGIVRVTGVPGFQEGEYLALDDPDQVLFVVRSSGERFARVRGTQVLLSIQDLERCFLLPNAQHADADLRNGEGEEDKGQFTVQDGWVHSFCSHVYPDQEDEPDDEYSFICYAMDQFAGWQVWIDLSNGQPTVPGQIHWVEVRP